MDFGLKDSRFKLIVGREFVTLLQKRNIEGQMGQFQRKYIVDENNQRVAVQLDIETFEKMEEVIENYGLAQLMREVENEIPLTVQEAQTYYATLKKAE